MKNYLFPWEMPTAIDETWSRYIPGVQPPTNIEILNRGEITLYNMEPLMGYPLPLMPNTISVGGVTNRPPKPHKFRTHSHLGEYKEWSSIYIIWNGPVFHTREIQLGIIQGL